jgi:hypothetical protein
LWSLFSSSPAVTYYNNLISSDSIHITSIRPLSLHQMFHLLLDACI